MPRLTKDDIGKRLMGRSDIFASVFNLLLYDGRQVIRAEELRDVPAEQLFFHGDESEKRVRDVFKMVLSKEDGKGRYLFLGEENQSRIDPYMIIRIMLYDAICYMRQVEDGRKKIVPSFTAVFNCSGKPWRKGMSLYDVIEVPDELRTFFEWYIGNHRLLLLDPYVMEEGRLEMLQHELSLVTFAMKWSTNKEKYSSFMLQNEMKNVSELVYDAIRILNNDRYLKRIVNKEGNIDMCLATELIAEEKRRQWTAEGKAEGKAEGQLEESVRAVSTLMRKYNLTADSAMDDLDIPASDRARILSLLSKSRQPDAEDGAF